MSLHRVSFAEKSRRPLENLDILAQRPVLPPQPRQLGPLITGQPGRSVLSDEDVPIEKISDLVGHKNQTTTETVYRHQIRPVVLHGAEAMDRIFPEG